MANPYRFIMSNSELANKRIAYNSLYMSIRMVIVLFLSLYSTRLILDALGVENYGIYSVVCGFVSIFSFLNISLSNGVQRFYNFELSQNGVRGANQVFCASMLIQLILAIVIGAVLELVGLWYINDVMVIPNERLSAANWVFHYSVLNFVFIVLQVPYTAAIMSHERFDFLAIISVIDALLKVLIALSLNRIGYDELIAYGVLLSIESFIICVAYFVFAKTHFTEIKFRFKFNTRLLKQMVSFSGWNIFGTFSGVMKDQGINLVINAFFGPVVNAARGIAMQVNSGIQGFVSNISTPVRPQVIQSFAQGNLTRTINLTYTTSKLSCYVLYIIALPISWEIDFVFKLWLGENIPEYSGTFVRIILMTSVLNNLNSAISGVVHATGNIRRYQITTSMVAVSAVPISYLVLFLGATPEWAFLTVFFTMILAQSVAIIELQRLITFSIKAYVQKVIIPLFIVICSTIGIPGILVYFMPQSSLRFFLNVLLSLILVTFVSYAIGITKNERLILNKYLHSIFK